jgi:hypothetical protein
VIANSEKEFSGTQGQSNWYNGYRQYDPAAGIVDYDPATDFVPFAGGADLGDWDGVNQTWTGSAWDLETASAAPWTYQAASTVHPNGTNSAPSDFEHWAVRRWIAKKLAKTTPVALTWLVKKENLANAGVTGLLFVNGKLQDTKTITGTNSTGEVRRYYVNLKPDDIVDLALSPEGPDGDRNDWSDGSIDWLWIDTKIPANPKQPDGTPFVPTGQLTVSGVYQGTAGQFVLTWASEAGLKYTVWASPDLKAWTAIKAGLDSGGASTSYTDSLGSPVPAFRFYKVSQP